MNELPELISSYKQAIYSIENYKNNILDLSNIRFLYPTTAAILCPFVKNNQPRIIFDNEDVLQYFRTIMYGNVNSSKTYIPFLELPKDNDDYSIISNKIYNEISKWSRNISQPLYIK